MAKHHPHNPTDYRLQATDQPQSGNHKPHHKFPNSQVAPATSFLRACEPFLTPCLLLNLLIATILFTTNTTTAQTQSGQQQVNAGGISITTPSTINLGTGFTNPETANELTKIFDNTDSSNHITVNDLRGSGEFTVTATPTSLTSGSNTFSYTNLSMLTTTVGDDSVDVTPSGTALNGASGPLDYNGNLSVTIPSENWSAFVDSGGEPSSPKTIIIGDDTGATGYRASFTVTPAFKLTIPIGQAAANYTSTITFTLNI